MKIELKLEQRRRGYKSVKSANNLLEYQIFNVTLCYKYSLNHNQLNELE